jgi:hypothetical protein
MNRTVLHVGRLEPTQCLEEQRSSVFCSTSGTSPRRRHHFELQTLLLGKENVYVMAQSLLEELNVSLGDLSPKERQVLVRTVHGTKTREEGHEHDPQQAHTAHKIPYRKQC